MGLTDLNQDVSSSSGIQGESCRGESTSLLFPISGSHLHSLVVVLSSILKASKAGLVFLKSHLLVLCFPHHISFCDSFKTYYYIGPTQITQYDLPVARSLNLIAPAKFFSPYQVSYSDRFQIRMWPSLGGHYSAYHNTLNYNNR